MNQEELHSILEKGIRAPSADNLQPWKIQIKRRESLLPEAGSTPWEIQLFLDTEKLSSFCDSGWLMPYLSMGAVIENIRVAAGALGYQTCVTYAADPENPSRVGCLTFNTAKTKGDPLNECIQKRITNRKFYSWKRKIPEALYDELQQTVTSQKGFRFFWIKHHEPAFEKLTKWIGDSDQIRFENERLHRELMDVMRIEKKEVESSRDGLPLDALEAGTGSSLLFKWIRKWDHLKGMNQLGLSVLFNHYARKQVESSQAVGLITAPTQRPEDYVRGGELMQRVWLKITRDDFAMQPMEALPIFILNLQINQGTDFNEKHKTKLEQLKKEFMSHFKLNEENGLIMLFRIGYTEFPPNTHSLRKPLSTFLVRDETASHLNSGGHAA